MFECHFHCIPSSSFILFEGSLVLEFLSCFKCAFFPYNWSLLLLFMIMTVGNVVPEKTRMARGKSVGSSHYRQRKQLACCDSLDWCCPLLSLCVKRQKLILFPFSKRNIISYFPHYDLCANYLQVSEKAAALPFFTRKKKTTKKLIKSRSLTMVQKLERLF